MGWWAVAEQPGGWVCRAAKCQRSHWEEVGRIGSPGFLKHRYRLGYESLCAEVSDSISWRRFCRLNIDDPLPHPSTLMKITTRCGETAVAALNEAVLAKATEVKLVKTGKVRADTTVVPASVNYPTDTGPLQQRLHLRPLLVRQITTPHTKIISN